MPKGKGYLGTKKQRKDIERAKKVSPAKKQVSIIELKNRYNAEIAKGNFDKADKIYKRIQKLQMEGKK